MKDKNKILIYFVLPSLAAGGAERVFAFLAKKINSNVFDVYLIIIGSADKTVYNTDNLKIVYLNKSRLLNAIPTLIKLLIKERPKIVCSSISHLNIVMAIISNFLKNIKFIGREASVVSEMIKYSQMSSFKKAINKYIISFTYPCLDYIVCQSNDMQVDLSENYNISNTKLIIINNPITFDFDIAPDSKNTGIINFITIGRLSSEKGHKRLLKILSLIDYDYKFTIIGNGPLLNEIESICDELKIRRKVELIKYSNDINKFLNESDYFLQGSYVEGFPNVLLESCYSGTPVIAFDVPGGTKEIIKNGVNGFLAKSELEFLEFLKNLKYSSNFKKSIVRASVINKFNANKITNEYELLFLKALKS